MGSPHDLAPLSHTAAVHRTGWVIVALGGMLLASCGSSSPTPVPSPEPPQIEVVVTNASRTPTPVQIRVSADLALARSTAGPCDAVAIRSRTPGTWEVLVGDEVVLSSTRAELCPRWALGKRYASVSVSLRMGRRASSESTVVPLDDFISGGAGLDPFRPAPEDCGS